MKKLQLSSQTIVQQNKIENKMKGNITIHKYSEVTPYFMGA